MRAPFFIVFMVLLVACRHNPDELVTPVADCDTDSVTYMLTILPMVQMRCALPGCHVSGGNGTGNFTTYTGLRSQVDNGKLVPAVQHTPGAIPMPPDGSMIPDCEIQRIVGWVNAGALEN